MSLSKEVCEALVPVSAHYKLRLTRYSIPEYACGINHDEVKLRREDNAWYEVNSQHRCYPCKLELKRTGYRNPLDSAGLNPLEGERYI